MPPGPPAIPLLPRSSSERIPLLSVLAGPQELVAPIADWPAARIARWHDEDWWHQQIDSAIADRNAANVNARITMLHSELAAAMTRIIGTEAGPTYHAWAVWASYKAGRVIRKEEARWTLAAMPIAGLIGGSALGLAALVVPGRTGKLPRTAGASGAALLGAITGWGLTRRALTRTSKSILAANVAVIDDLGRQTARFACAFAREQDRTPEALDAFLESLSPAPSAQGGQSLLRAAYRHYFNAARESRPQRRDQCVLLGNLSALLHEHWRLQRFFTAAIPRRVRRAVTAHALKFQVGSQWFSVGRDVAAPVGSDTYPPTLATIELPELQEFLSVWDRTPNSPQGSAATDWCEIGDRLNYIVDLFRCHHHNPEVWEMPYGAGEQKRILELSDVA